ncbi:MAG: transcriptional repressor [Fibrobacterales bacterium]
MVAQSSITQYLLHHGIKPSFQRIKIFEYLMGQEEFPTIETMYRDLKSELSTLSKTTIYNTLREFNRKSILSRVNQNLISEFQNTNTTISLTVQCTQCDSIETHITERNSLPDIIANTFSLSTTTLTIHGKCKKH